jgi:hypothetical protein
LSGRNWADGAEHACVHDDSDFEFSSGSGGLSGPRGLDGGDEDRDGRVERAAGEDRRDLLQHQVPQAAFTLVEIAAGIVIAAEITGAGTASLFESTEPRGLPYWLIVIFWGRSSSGWCSPSAPGRARPAL